ncbi:hypothetical protein SLNWT_4999 [Streptomyces albus]|uniref:Uncharacterized protein n=1 Tax=Streptomyces albus (strain ATCC 21838 / DSM 41398 / FERM P-419 / JCM 4703 / NBRC 107858) TaxID=1081613 RepID=A0A0B5F1E1_STRA4|nr:hypothetical protein SLNWT_4999 [Streptomyces albus]
MRTVSRYAVSVGLLRTPSPRTPRLRCPLRRFSNVHAPSPSP